MVHKKFQPAETAKIKCQEAPKVKSRGIGGKEVVLKRLKGSTGGRRSAFNDGSRKRVIRRNGTITRTLYNGVMSVGEKGARTHFLWGRRESLEVLEEETHRFVDKT